MEGLEEEIGYRPGKKTNIIDRQINFNDIHYCNLQAVIEADSGLDALERFILERSSQIFREADSAGEEHLEITKQDIKSNARILRQDPEIKEELQLSQFKISRSDGSNVIIWVYRMGEHWVICN
ncbi:MAG: hypothetical protein JSV49_11530 [Thermoplasmata archaeon]|nr:MAG: hypothetical protein JSV49_11530 [Thermoplasmata archaeon]